MPPVQSQWNAEWWKGLNDDEAWRVSSVGASNARAAKQGSSAGFQGWSIEDG